jgi:hypothetical protein
VDRQTTSRSNRFLDAAGHAGAHVTVAARSGSEIEAGAEAINMQSALLGFGRTAGECRNHLQGDK